MRARSRTVLTKLADLYNNGAKSCKSAMLRPDQETVGRRRRLRDGRTFRRHIPREDIENLYLEIYTAY
jgi:hypothetical protein